MGAVESKFADLIWENEPVSSSDLWKLAEESIGWKKTTTFTVLKRLCEKGLFKNEKGNVTSLVSRSDFYSLRSERFVNEAFDGSLPAFLSAFVRGKTLTAEEVEELRRIVADYDGE